MFTLPVRVSPLLLLRTSSSALILNVVLKISHVHSVNRSRNMARAQTLKMAKSNAGLVPTNKLLVPTSFFALFHLKLRPCIKVGCKIRGGEDAVNKGLTGFYFMTLLGSERHKIK